MPSPFPGMDPYLEEPDWWRGFHHNLATEIQAQLAPRVRPRYYTDIEIYIPYTEDDPVRVIAPDVRVMRAWRELPSPEPAGVALAPAPVTRAIPIELPEKTYSVNIYDARNNLLVTAIELLSPANKRLGHEAYFQYRRKRQRLLLSEVHLMEIDLLRDGERLPYSEPLPDAPYFVSLSRAGRRPIAEIWPLRLPDAIPWLPVPLLSPDADVPLDLGAAIAPIYERGAYDLRIDYSQPPPPPLSEADQQWLDAHLRKQGVRYEKCVVAEPEFRKVDVTLNRHLIQPRVSRTTRWRSRHCVAG